MAVGETVVPALVLSAVDDGEIGFELVWALLPAMKVAGAVAHEDVKNDVADAADDAAVDTPVVLEGTGTGVELV